jgi:DNA-binding NtrC family response regulator
MDKLQPTTHNSLPQAMDFLLKEFADLKAQLKDFKKELSTQTTNDDLMTREQVLDFLQINGSTLWRYQNKGRITVYKFSNKCYYKRSELMATITPLNK